MAHVEFDVETAIVVVQGNETRPAMWWWCATESDFIPGYMTGSMYE